MQRFRARSCAARWAHADAPSAATPGARSHPSAARGRNPGKTASCGGGETAGAASAHTVHKRRTRTSARHWTGRSLHSARAGAPLVHQSGPGNGRNGTPRWDPHRRDVATRSPCLPVPYLLDRHTGTLRLADRPPKSARITSGYVRRPTHRATADKIAALRQLSFRPRPPVARRTLTSNLRHPQRCSQIPPSSACGWLGRDDNQ